MKILFENWKKFINEGPFDEIGSGTYDVETKPIIRRTAQEKQQRKSIGYDRFKKDKKFISSVKSLMGKTKDNWIFIFPKDKYTVIYEDYRIKLEEWLKEKLNDPKYNNSIVLVVAESPLSEQDNTDANWLLHDLIGHDIGNQYFPQTEVKLNKDVDIDFIEDIHQNLLTRDTSPATANFDKIYDILAAIVLGELTKDKLTEYANKNYPNKNLSKSINTLFSKTSLWMKKLPRWPNGYTKIMPWYSEDESFGEVDNIVLF
jgi:hypothetical protein